MVQIPSEAAQCFCISWICALTLPRFFTILLPHFTTKSRYYTREHVHCLTLLAPFFLSSSALCSRVLFKSVWCSVIPKPCLLLQTALSPTQSICYSITHSVCLHAHHSSIYLILSTSVHTLIYHILLLYMYIVFIYHILLLYMYIVFIYHILIYHIHVHCIYIPYTYIPYTLYLYTCTCTHMHILNNYTCILLK